MALCNCANELVREPVKAKVLPAVKPKVAEDQDSTPLLTFWVAPEHYDDYAKENDRGDKFPMGIAAYGTNVQFIRAPYVPYAYRIDSDVRYDHAHYVERLAHIPGAKTVTVDDEGNYDHEGGNAEKVTNAAAAKDLHGHECGHALMRWKHDTGHPVMDGTSDGERVPLGLRCDLGFRAEYGITERHGLKNEDAVNINLLLDRIVDIHPTIEMHQWLPGMGTPSQVAKEHPRGVTGRRAFKYAP